jgi:hypothetical protein
MATSGPHHIFIYKAHLGYVEHQTMMRVTICILDVSASCVVETKNAPPIAAISFGASSHVVIFGGTALVPTYYLR